MFLGSVGNLNYKTSTPKSSSSLKYQSDRQLPLVNNSMEQTTQQVYTGKFILKYEGLSVMYLFRILQLLYRTILINIWVCIYPLVCVLK